jgi:hypothetical protein
MTNYTRFGYSSKIEMKRILKRKSFARWQAGVILKVFCEQDH